MKVSLPLSLVLLFGLVGSAHALVEGQSLRDREVPQFGQIRSFQLWGCGATLIAPRVLITAAHCVDENPGRLHFEAPLGRRSNFGRRFKVESIKLYPLNPLARPGSHGSAGYVSHASVNHDLALLILKEPVTSVAPLEIAAEQSRVESPVQIFGFRDLQFRVSAPGFVRDVDLTSVEVEFDSSRSRAVGGDSGSPVLNAEGELIGILCKTILGTNRAYMADVTRARNWIRTIIDITNQELSTDD
jgi:V8-like Glu-specific endopeptidase